MVDNLLYLSSTLWWKEWFYIHYWDLFHNHQTENGCYEISLKSNRNSDVLLFATLHYFLTLGKESGDPQSPASGKKKLTKFGSANHEIWMHLKHQNVLYFGFFCHLLSSRRIKPNLNISITLGPWLTQHIELYLISKIFLRQNHLFRSSFL